MIWTYACDGCGERVEQGDLMIPDHAPEDFRDGRVAFCRSCCDDRVVIEWEKVEPRHVGL